jgi:pimeloyl-ACP methyl ester carboxylesterase
VDLAEEMTDFFDVYTFDFRGHGASDGVLDLEHGLEGPAADLEAVLGLVREGGHLWVGVAGFSLGGMAAFALAVEKPHLFDALAVVGMPPRFPDTDPYRMWLPLWFLLLRGLGARFAGQKTQGPSPLDLASAFPPGLPLLLVHGEREAFYPREDLLDLVERLKGKADFLLVPDAGHAELASGKRRFISWFVERQGRG